MSTELADRIEALRLVDHHVHSALRTAPSRDQFELLITESDRPAPAGTSQFDSQVGYAVRAHCAPVLGLAAHPEPDQYWAARERRSAEDLARAFLDASGTSHLFVDTGYKSDDLLPLDRLEQLGHPLQVREILRLESLLEQVAAHSTPHQLHEDFQAALNAALPHVIGLKSIIAYRHGFAIDPQRPTGDEIRRAAERWMTQRRAEPLRVSDPVLLRMVLWAGADTGLPLQLHVGYGDPDLDLNTADPLLLTPWIRAVEHTGTRLMLLHCYPFHRNAGFLAQAFPHVYMDIGLAINYTGAASAHLIAESLELAPFAKVLYSSDAWGPPELHYLGARLFRRGLTTALSRWVQSGEWSMADAVRVATMVGRENALRVYGINE